MAPEKSSPRVKIYGRNSDALTPLLKRFGLKQDDERPDVVITYGGDGTVLSAEREWPGVPKVALRDSRRCRTCSHHSNEEILEHLANGTLKRMQFLKLKALALGQERIGLNDIIIHNPSINVGLRLQVQIDGDAYTEKEIVGDGIVVATPFGSTAYFASITRCTFRSGLGLAFNNCVDQINHVIAGESSVIKVRITRGPASLTADNVPETLRVQEGDEITIQQADQAATILMFDRVRFLEKQLEY